MYVRITILLLGALFLMSMSYESFSSSKFYHKNGLAGIALRGDKKIDFVVLLRSKNGNVNFSADHGIWKFTSFGKQEITLSSRKEGSDKNNFKVIYEGDKGEWICLDRIDFLYVDKSNLIKLIDKLIDDNSILNQNSQSQGKFNIPGK